MAYQVIARKWRPKRFADMVGQEHIARTLRNAVITGRVAQAYLFVGPRGIGKTTTARIFAKALNCKHPVDGEPCCECESCRAIAEERSVDVIEIDAATHTQVDNARTICEEALTMPISSKYKIFIIDEVHMLSKSAWNALLKTIEEPPEHVKFIFATTEVNKVLATVISRCQRFDLKRIPANLIADRLELIAKTEKVAISRPAIDVIARAADGGMRDAQSLLDQMISFFASGTNQGAEITEQQALSLFGLTAPAQMKGLIAALVCNNARSVIAGIHALASDGKNLEVLFDEILSWLRGILMVTILPDPASVLDENPERIEIYRELSKAAGPGVVQRLLEQLASTGFLLRDAINKQVFIETVLLKGMRLAHAPQASDIIARLNYIRKTGELAPLNSVPAYLDLPPRLVIERVGAAPAAAQEPISAPAQVPAPAANAVPAPKPAPVSAEQAPAPEPTPVSAEQTPSPEPEPVPEEPVPEKEPEHRFEEVVEEVRAPSILSDPAAPPDCDDAADDAPSVPVPPPLPRKPKKSLDQLIAEAGTNPIVKQAGDLFEGRVVDVMEQNPEE